MKAEQVDKALRQKFFIEDQRLVFWHDANGEFSDYVGAGFEGELATVQLLEPAKLGGIASKLKLEREQPESKFLVYTTGDSPDAEHDLLFDIRLYSAEFRADVASIWLQELGLQRLSMRDHLSARSAFLGNQERRRKLASRVAPQDDEAAIDLKMLAVLVDSDVASPFAVLRALCHGHLKDGRFSLETTPAVFESLDKLSLAESFWQFMMQEFGYDASEPKLAGLLRQLFVSELLHQLRSEPIDSLTHFELPAKGRRNAIVFLTQWRDSGAHGLSYDAAAAALGRELSIADRLSALPLHAVCDVVSFWEAERRIVAGLKAEVLEALHAVNANTTAELARARLANHWLAGPGKDDPERRAVAAAYEAIVAAAELFTLHAQHRHTLTFESPAALLDAYQHTLHRFDRLYRQFCFKAKAAHEQGWDLLKSLAVQVEQVYDDGFLQPLGREWSRLLDEGFLQAWSLPELPSQQNFYKDNIREHLLGSARRRAFVIISDAFRYEAAAELVETLNATHRVEAERSAMLGVLPSYTALGMASLLPHQTLSYTDKGEPLVDGKSTATTEARSKQLATVDGMACQAKELRSMKTDDARAFTEGKRVVYIYHDVIDATGDKRVTEDKTFDAVAICISEVLELAMFCINKLNAAKVWITADHGFLFQQEALDDTDRTTLAHKPAGAVKDNNRCVIGRHLGDQPDAHFGNTKTTAGTSDSMEFWVPRGANRFHFGGGARFVHGGAMPQEVVVPVVTVTQLRGKKADSSRIAKVAVQVLGSNHKITTPVYRFELIQLEPVTERRMPITLRAAVYDGATPVTSVETVAFDSSSDNIEERKRSVRVELATGTYDKTKPYRLVLRDASSDTEVQSVQVVIDRSFDDDF